MFSLWLNQLNALSLQPSGLTSSSAPIPMNIYFSNLCLTSIYNICNISNRNINYKNLDISAFTSNLIALCFLWQYKGITWFIFDRSFAILGIKEIISLPNK